MSKKTLILVVSSILISCFCIFVYTQSQEEEDLSIATEAFSDGFYDASITLLEKFVNKYPDSSQIYLARIYMAKSLYFKKNYPQAVNVLNELVLGEDAQAFLDEVYYWIAEINFASENYPEVLNYASKLITRFAASKFLWEAYNLRAQASLKMGDYETAKAAFKQVIDSSGDTKFIDNAYAQLLELNYKLKDYPAIESLASRYLRSKLQKALNGKMHFYRAEAYYAGLRYDKAMREYEKALKITKDDDIRSLIFEGIGLCFLAKEDFDAAKYNFKKISSEEYKLHAYGIYYFKIRNYILALDKFETFLNKFPESDNAAGVYLNKADCLYEMGRLKDALYVYKNIINSFDSRRYREIIDKAYYGIAWSYLKVGELRKAIGEFEDTIKYTDNPIVKITSLLQIADAYQDIKSFDKALASYNSIIEKYPDSIYSDYILFQKGVIFLKTKKEQEALSAFGDLKDNFPSSRLLPEAQYYLGVIYFSESNYRKAEIILGEFIKKWPSDALAAKVNYLYNKCLLAQKQFTKALRGFDFIIKNFNDKEIEELAYADKAKIFFDLGQYGKSKDSWMRFLDKFPASSNKLSAYFYLAKIYEKSDDSSAARDYYQLVLENNPQEPFRSEAAISLGYLFWKDGNIQRAEDYFRELSGGDDEFAFKAKLYLAELLAQRGKAKEALVIYDQCIDSATDIAKLAIVKKAFFLKEVKDYSAAVSFFKKAIENDSDDASLGLALGFCLEKLKKYKEAVEEYFLIIYNLDDNDLDNKIKVYFRIARVYERANDAKGAINVYRKIIAYDREESKIAEKRLKELESQMRLRLLK